MGGQDAVAAAIDEAEHVVVRDLLAKTNAARAEDAALIIQGDARPELDVLRLLDLVLEETRIGPPIFNAELLQAAFAGLVADRAIERVIDEEEFHHSFPAFLGQRRIGANAHSVAHILGAGDLRARHPVDDRLSIRTELRFAVRPHFRQTHFDQAHAAVTGGAELLVITVARHIAARLLTGLDQTRALGKLTPDAVDLDVDHLRWCWRLIAHQKMQKAKDESGTQEAMKD